jgi:hypothetical protein
MTFASLRAAALAAALGVIAGASAQSVTTLNIDTRDTGVDLGLQHNPDGSISAKLPPGVRVPTLDNGASATTQTRATGAATVADVNANPLTPGALGTAPADRAAPGTSTFGNPTSAGRVNGNSGTDNGRSTPDVSGGTGIVNSGTSGNGLGAPSGNTGAGPAATGTTGAGNAATGNTGNATAGATVDAATAAQAASNSRSVSGAITGNDARILNGTPGSALANGRGMGTLSNGSTTGASSGNGGR